VGAKEKRNIPCLVFGQAADVTHGARGGQHEKEHRMKKEAGSAKGRTPCRGLERKDEQTEIKEGCGAGKGGKHRKAVNWIENPVKRKGADHECTETKW